MHNWPSVSDFIWKLGTFGCLCVCVCEMISLITLLLETSLKSNANTLISQHIHFLYVYFKTREPLKVSGIWQEKKTESWRSEGKPGGREAEKAETRFMPPAYKPDTRNSVFTFAVFFFVVFPKKVILVPLLG